MCPIIIALNKEGANYTGCADCPYSAECATESDPEIPY